MTVPEWLVPILQQFPIVTLALVTTGLAAWWLKRSQKEELARLERVQTESLKRADADILRVREDRRSDEVRHSAEIERMTASHKEQVELLKQQLQVALGKPGRRGT